jgi:hypothetical protein
MYFGRENDLIGLDGDWDDDKNSEVAHRTTDTVALRRRCEPVSTASTHRFTMGEVQEHG